MSDEIDLFDCESDRPEGPEIFTPGDASELDSLSDADDDEEALYGEFDALFVTPIKGGKFESSTRAKQEPPETIAQRLQAHFEEASSEDPAAPAALAAPTPSQLVAQAVDKEEHRLSKSRQVVTPGQKLIAVHYFVNLKYTKKEVMRIMRKRFHVEVQHSQLSKWGKQVNEIFDGQGTLAKGRQRVEGGGTKRVGIFLKRRKRWNG
jgi:hypothetical protein